MKKTMIPIALVAGLLSVSAFAGLSGGFSPADTTDSDVVLASRYLTREVSADTGMSVDIVDVQSAMTQVVAGTNYRLCMAVTVNDDRRRHLAGIVYKPLSGGMLLTRWGWVPSCFAGGKEGL